MKLPSNECCFFPLLNKVKIQITLPKMAVYPGRVNYPSSGTTDVKEMKKLTWMALYCSLVLPLLKYNKMTVETLLVVQSS